MTQSVQSSRIPTQPFLSLPPPKKHSPQFSHFISQNSSSSKNIQATLFHPATPSPFSSFHGIKATSIGDLLETLGCKKIKQIGSGSQGKVCTYKTNRGEVAIKYICDGFFDVDSNLPFVKIEVDKTSGEILRGEGLALSTPDHPNLVKTFGLIIKSSKTCFQFLTKISSLKDYKNSLIVGIVMEYFADSMTLTEALLAKVVPFSKSELKHIFYQIATGVNALHSHGILHRDLKLTNVLIKNRAIKIIDYGFGRNLKTAKNNQTFTRCGSPCFAPPEILPDKGFWSFKGDIWSLGLIFYCLTFDALPPFCCHTNPRAIFEAVENFLESEKTLEEAVKPSLLHTKTSLRDDKLLWSLLNQMITSQNQRLSLAQVLTHPFFKDCGSIVKKVDSLSGDTARETFDYQEPWLILSKVDFCPFSNTRSSFSKNSTTTSPSNLIHKE